MSSSTGADTYGSVSADGTCTATDELRATANTISFLTQDLMRTDLSSFDVVYVNNLMFHRLNPQMGRKFNAELKEG